MSTATVIGLPVRWKWVPVEHCNRCREAHPVDSLCSIRLEVTDG